MCATFGTNALAVPRGDKRMQKGITVRGKPTGTGNMAGEELY